MNSKNKNTTAVEINHCISASTTMTSYAVRFVPCSSRLVALGQFARGTGCFQVYNINGKSLKLTAEVETAKPIKCGTFGASSLETRAIATGNFVGDLAIYDVEVPASPVYCVKAHEQIINAIDGVGGMSSQNGAPEIATASRDGRFVLLYFVSFIRHSYLLYYLFIYLFIYLLNQYYSEMNISLSSPPFLLCQVTMCFFLQSVCL